MHFINDCREQHSTPTLNLNARVAAFILYLGVGSVFSTATLAASTAPLIQKSDIAYLGAFALPSWANQTSSSAYGTSWFEYGGMALTFYKDTATGKRTLYMQGHAQNPGQIAQVEIPSTLVTSPNWSALPMANILHKFVGVPHEPGGASCNANPSFIYGMIGYGGRLIISAACSYGGSQTTSHGVRSLNLSTAGFQGFYGFSGTVAPPRALGGYMTLIPPEWQSLFGGPAFTGLSSVSVTGSTSSGPASTVFDPNDVGVKNPIPGKTVLFFPLEHPACDANNPACEWTQNNIYNLSSVYQGVAFPAGSRSVLYIGAHGTGCYWYGGSDEAGKNGCPTNDPALPDVKGPHAPPYQYQILAYDANDLLAVRNGSKQTWEPKPYAIIRLDGMANNSNNGLKGAGYDMESGRLYIAQDYAERPRIEVYQITVSGASEAIATPTNLRIL